MKSRFFLLALCLFLPLASCTPTNTFEENANKTATSTDAVVDEAVVPAADAQTTDDAKPAETADDDAIPAVPENGTLKDYREYVNKLNDMLNDKAKDMIAQAQKDGVSPASEEFSNNLKEIANEYFGRIIQATDKAMLLKDVTDKEFEELVGAKIQILMMLSQVNDDDEEAVNAKLNAFVAQLRDMDKNKIADQIEAQVFQSKILTYARSGDVKEFAKAAAQVDENIEKAGKDITPALAQQAMLIVLASSQLPGYEAPEGRIDKIKKAFAEASDPEVNEMVEELEEALYRAEGVKRFSEALGNEFKFGGTFIDGSEYKAEDYAGKVVLIDFWATWCGPCCAELPNVKKAYADYHDKGFEIIGVTCDKPEKEVEFKEFLKENEITWKQMFDEKAVVPDQQTKDGKPIPVSIYYGIGGIPCPILIGADGKVLSLNARGEELEEQLAKIYSEVKEETPAEETPAEETPAEETPAEETPAEEAPAEEAPAEEAPAEETPAEETPAEEAPAEPAAPAEEAPAEPATPAEEAPAEPAAPAEEAPAEPAAPAEEAPAEPAAPAEEAASETTSDVIVSESVNDEGESKKDDAADDADDAIPAVPESGTLEDYQDCITTLRMELQNKVQSMIAQARKDGVNPQSEAFTNSLKEMAKEYFARIEQAADKAMLLKDVSDDDFKQLANYKFQTIRTLAELSKEDESAVSAKIEAFAKQLREMGKNDVAEQIEGFLFMEKVRGYLHSGNVEAFTKVAAEIDEKVEKAGKDISLSLAQKAGLILIVGATLSDYKAPEGRQEKYLKALAESSDPEVQKIAGEMEKQMMRAEGEKRFNDSLGKEFKFGGTFTNGSEYNAKDYAGKVVLIDFWATWCGPCCRELPNVKKMYDAYHDKGFEVIGVTCDDPENEEDFNQFLKEKEIPWKQMFDGKAVVPGLKTKTGEPILVSEYYAINAIPCPVLIGKDGKVVSLDARGAELKKQLVKIYGEVEGLDAANEEEDEVLDVVDDEDAEEEDDADEDDQAADEAIPDVPETGTLAEYKEYVKKVNVLLNKKAQRMFRQAKKDGVNQQSEDFANSLKEMGKEYFSRMEQATDKAMLLKDLSDDELAELVGAKVQLIQIVTNLNDDKIDVVSAKLQAIADQLRKMGKEEFAKDIEDSIFRTQLQNYVQTNNIEAFTKAAAEVDEKVKKAGKDITPDLAQLALMVVLGANDLPDYKAPEGRNDNYLKALSEATDPEVQEYVDVLRTVINQKDEQ